jgi:hypothetical protein
MSWSREMPGHFIIIQYEKFIIIDTFKVITYSFFKTISFTNIEYITQFTFKDIYTIYFDKN